MEAGFPRISVAFTEEERLMPKFSFRYKASRTNIPIGFKQIVASQATLLQPIVRAATKLVRGMAKGLMQHCRFLV